MRFSPLVGSLGLLATVYAGLDASNCTRSTGEYDFIVIGGGTAGLTLASRLNERLLDQCILVIEAGSDGSSEPRITIPGYRGTTFASKYDWNLTTTPQPGLNNRIVNLVRGKVLGGSSALNLMTWDRASIQEYDAWEKLGNPGWNWATMYPAMLRVETFNRTFLGPGYYGEEGVGDSGLVDTFINEQVPEQQLAWIPTMENLSLEQNLESLAGNPLGVMYQPSNIRRSDYTRSYSPTYLTLRTQNLKVLTDTAVSKIDTDGTTPTATGVTLSDGRIIKARKEVILSTGTYQTPQLLELSGIGNRSILAAAGIDQLVELPGVGENLQDHLRIQNSYQLKPNYTSFDIVRFNSTRAAQELGLYHAGQASLYRYTGSGYAFMTWDSAFNDSSALTRLAEENAGTDSVSQQKLVYLTDSESRQTVPQLELIFSDGYTGARGYPAPTSPDYGKQFISILAAIMHPFGRGSVHVNASSPASAPVINHNYLGNEYDLHAVRMTAQYIRRVANTAPLADLWQAEFDPGAAVQADDEWLGYVRNSTGTIYHPVGTAAMLPLVDGGVVDPNLRVYGVRGLRIVDASVIPITISAHIQTAVYGIAERAAEIIAAEWSKIA